MFRLPFLIVVALGLAASAFGQPPITYAVTFPEPEHHWMQVEVMFSGFGSAPLHARMSRSSPGRYAVHEFAKNVFSVEAFDGKGRNLASTRPNPYQWDVAGHDGTVRLVYKIFGDTADGSYMAVDTTHAHLNMPAAFMWALGLEDRSLRITFTPPAGLPWKIGTQLFPTSDPWTFTAPNLQYFMDSPTELSDFVTSTFSLPNPGGKPASFRIVAHSDGSQADVDELATMVKRLVQEQMAVFGEFPEYEPGSYTFLLDYVPWGDGDGMEHRNSTFISEPYVSLKTESGRQRAMGAISHEFFHNWNVERIRPAGLEPFDFTGANITCCLWVAEGFTQYYGSLLLTRAGFSAATPAGTAAAVINGSGRTVRSAVQMSEYAAFADAATSIDRTDANRTFISYYTYGAALALALDLSLREMSGGRQSLDDYMRLLWNTHGKPGGAQPGLVAKPYTLKDLRDRLAELTGKRSFADDFFDRYVEGREVADYATLLAAAGYVMRPRNADAGWLGNVQVAEETGGLRIGVSGAGGRGQAVPVAFNTPLYRAGVDSGDVITSIDGQPATLAAWSAISRKKPGDNMSVSVRRRDGSSVDTTITLAPDPALSIVDASPLTDAQKAFRAAWLGSLVARQRQD